MRRSLKPVMGKRQTRPATDVVAERTASFADMFDDHVDEVYRFVHRRCRDHSLAEDITQETFVTAIRSTDDPSSISIGWLLTVARNRLFDVLKRQTQFERKLRIVGAADVDGHDDELVERVRIERALSELSTDHRLVLTLHYIDGYTVPGLAEHLDRSVKSIEGLVTRARRELRANLDDSGSDAGIGASHD